MPEKYPNDIDDSSPSDIASLDQPSYKIAIVGSGPAGLSAAARAAELSVSHVLLEATSAAANTIRKYQKAKHVMAEPSHLALRSAIPFRSGTREWVIDAWESALQNQPINLQLNAQVVAIAGEKGNFSLQLASGDIIHAELIVLAIGLQGNIRKLNVPGANHPLVQYQLDDPIELVDETIVVIGGGDAGIENALALKVQNHVILINQQEDFISCRDENFDRILTALKGGELECRLDTSVSLMEHRTDEDFPLAVVVNTPEGTESIACHRVLARLGAEPPRQLLESFGIHFQGEHASALPHLSPQGESSVSGLYIVGALAGFPLIKQALNQGYDVIDSALGFRVVSLAETLLKEKLDQCCVCTSTAEGLLLLQANIPMLATMDEQQLRDFLMESAILQYDAGETVFERNDYSNSLFAIAEGAVDVFVDANASANARLTTGDFFGEMGLISGRRRSATIVASRRSIMIETPRRTMLKMLNVVDDLRRMLDEAALKRAIHSYLKLTISETELDSLVSHAKLCKFAVGEALFHEGDAADGLHLIRRGSVTISNTIAGREYTLSYVSSGNYVGEMALLSGKPRSASVRAAVNTETILLASHHLTALIEKNPALRHELDERYIDNVGKAETQQAGADVRKPTTTKANNLVSFLTEQGIGEATDVLLIDYTKCIRCDNCEKACADTHGGTSHLDREAGATFAQIHVPTSCRHCEHPHCMKDCPPDSIHRSINGEVYITDQCIGCGNCVKNCPYDVIQLATSKPTSRDKSLLGHLIEMATGFNGANHISDERGHQRAVKCDMCKSFREGPVCVRACPTGAALRVTPEEFLTYAKQLDYDSTQ